MPEQLNQTNDLAVMLSRIQAAEHGLAAKRSEVPLWIWDNYIACRRSQNHTSMWEICLPVRFRIKEITYNYRYIHRVAASKECTVKLWLPLDSAGKYVITQLHTEREESLPHVYGWSACLSVGDGPPQISCMADFKRMKDSLARALSQINLSSLLSTIKRQWPKEVVSAIPPAIRKRIGRRRMGSLSQVDLETYFVRTEVEREDQTWAVGITLP